VFIFIFAEKKKKGGRKEGSLPFKLSRRERDSQVLKGGGGRKVDLSFLFGRKRKGGEKRHITVLSTKKEKERGKT